MLTQFEADALVDMQKKRAGEEMYDFPLVGETLSIPIISVDARESFLIDISRAIIRLTKCTYQKRYQGVIILVRLDIDGPPHSNPEVLTVPLSRLEPYNGKTVSCPHLHLYVEGFMDRWAIPAPSETFPKMEDIYATLDDFFRYCNVLEPPLVQRRLF